jgi:hypothetical protein
MTLKSSALMEAVIDFLLPYFMPSALDIHDARIEIVDTLTAYAARTRSEYLQVARIIAFSMTALDVLAEAKTTDMSLSMRVRYRGCANNLNRTTMQLEKALDQRLALDAAQPDAAHCDAPQCDAPQYDMTQPDAAQFDIPECEIPDTAAPAPQPAVETRHVDEQGDVVARVTAAIAAHRQGLAYHQGLASSQPTTGTLAAHQAERNKQLWAQTMIDTLQQMGIPVQRIPSP